MTLPVDYINYMKKLLGDEFDAYIGSFDMESVHGLRVNRLKLESDDFARISPFSIEKIPFIDNGFTYNNKDNPAKDAYYHAGLYYLQEPSAMLPANRLPVKKGDKVLDLCAAPGGKATELAGKLYGTGVLYANDISVSRAQSLLKNLELAGAENIYVTAESPDNLASRLPLYFDKILCDVPCSGEGMFRKDASLIRSWENKRPETYTDVQRSILESAYKMLKPGGMIMYSTCTFDICEDEENIAWFIDNHSDMSLTDIDGYEGFSEGLLGLNKCVRVYPHRINGEGHFMALMIKSSEDNSLNDIKELPGNELSGSSYSEPLGKIIKVTSRDKKSVTEYRLPALTDNGHRDGLRYLRTGLMLSDSQHYAMTLNSDKFDNCLNLNHDDIRVTKYLKGETIFLTEEERLDKGPVLILVDGFSLGFAKNDGNGKLKNQYNAGWRMN